jgi:hypothetical protein
MLFNLFLCGLGFTSISGCLLNSIVALIKCTIGLISERICSHEVIHIVSILHTGVCRCFFSPLEKIHLCLSHVEPRLSKILRAWAHSRTHKVVCLVVQVAVNCLNRFGQPDQLAIISLALAESVDVFWSCHRQSSDD